MKKFLIILLFLFILLIPQSIEGKVFSTNPSICYEPITYDGDWQELYTTIAMDDLPQDWRPIFIFLTDDLRDEITFSFNKKYQEIYISIINPEMNFQINYYHENNKDLILDLSTLPSGIFYIFIFSK